MMYNFSSKGFIFALATTQLSLTYAVEVKPFNFIKNENEYPEKIALYKVSNNHSNLYIQQYPFQIENSNRNSGFKSEISPECETLEKIYKQKNKTYIVSRTCGAWFGMSNPGVHYMIYEFNDVSKLVNTETIKFSEALNIYISELSSGIKITSSQSNLNGKNYSFEYKDGSLLDFSTAMDRQKIKNDKYRVCKGFYDQVFSKYKYDFVPGKSSLYEILSQQEYSWVPTNVKNSEELSDKLANALKGKDLGSRQSMPFALFEKEYCL